MGVVWHVAMGVVWHVAMGVVWHVVYMCDVRTSVCFMVKTVVTSEGEV